MNKKGNDWAILLSALEESLPFHSGVYAVPKRPFLFRCVSLLADTNISVNQHTVERKKQNEQKKILIEFTWIVVSCGYSS